jgi:hypothetical protein
MTADFVLHALLGLLPVCCFLAALVYLDSYKLVPLKWVVGTIILGCATGVASYPLNWIGLQWLDVGFTAYTRYVAPITEEALKATVIWVLMRNNRIGFLVDAAIFGFAVGAGFAADTELLELINSGELSNSKVGMYLQSLREKFEGPIVADLLCYLRLHTELSIRAKGLLMMRESGFMNKTGEETRAKLEELRYLEKSIGATGKLAIKPFLRMSQKDLWQFYMLSA